MSHLTAARIAYGLASSKFPELFPDFKQDEDDGWPEDLLWDEKTSAFYLSWYIKPGDEDGEDSLTWLLIKNDTVSVIGIVPPVDTLQDFNDALQE